MESGISNRPLIQHIYIHIPFCLTKCGYCSFYSVPYHMDRVKAYLQELHNEITLYRKSFPIMPQTVYFGGGTPSLVSPAEIGAILSQFDLSACMEITLEMNPITVTENYLSALNKTPVNRISLGGQSFVDTELKFLERRHTAAQIAQKVTLLREYGYDNISIDLMYGLPKQSLTEAQTSLDAILKIAPEHISTYCLSIEDKTAFHDKGVESPDDDHVADIYDLIRQVLVANGYIHYEISNFAKKGLESRHNLAYWDGKGYLGLGAGASGFIEKIRYMNAEDLNQYKIDVEAETLFPNGMEESPSDLEKEYIFMNLRKATGLELSVYHDKFGKDFYVQYRDVIDKYAKMNLLTINADAIALNSAAYFISNEILNEFM